MHWFSRPLLFLAIALVFVAAFLGLNQLGAFRSYEMTGFPGSGPPAQAQLSSGAPGQGTASASKDATAAPANTSSSASLVRQASEGNAANTTAASGAEVGGPAGRPGGERRGGFNGQELPKDLGLIAGAWLALLAYDAVFGRRRQAHITAQP